MSEHPHAAAARVGFESFVRGEREGRILDIEQALFIRVEDGLWTDIRAQPLDQAAFDTFWA